MIKIKDFESILLFLKSLTMKRDAEKKRERFIMSQKMRDIEESIKQSDTFELMNSYLAGISYLPSRIEYI